MILLDVAKKMKEEMGYESIPTNDIVEALRNGFETIKKLAIAEGENFALQVPKFGTFQVIKRKARTGFNPQKNEPMQIPEKLRFKLKVSSTINQSLALPKKNKKNKKK